MLQYSSYNVQLEGRSARRLECCWPARVLPQLYKTRCFYDSDSGQSRKSTTRREIAAFTREESAITIIRAIKSYPIAEVTNIIDAIRTNENLDIITESLRKNATLPDVSDISLTKERSDQVIGSAINPRYRLLSPDPFQNNICHESVVPGGPSIPSLASPLSYDPSQNFSWSPFIDGSVPIPSHTAVGQMEYSTGLPQLGNQWQLYQDGSPSYSSVNGHWP